MKLKLNKTRITLTALFWSVTLTIAASPFVEELHTPAKVFLWPLAVFSVLAFVEAGQDQEEELKKIRQKSYEEISKGARGMSIMSEIRWTMILLSGIINLSMENLVLGVLSSITVVFGYTLQEGRRTQHQEVKEEMEQEIVDSEES